MAAVIYDLENANVGADADVDYSKLQHVHSWHYPPQQGDIPPGFVVGPVTDATCFLANVRGTTGAVLALRATITGALATHASRTISIDLLKSTGAAAFASILQAALTFSSADTLRLTKAATIATTGLQVGDHLKLTVTVAGSSGNQAQGLSLSVYWWEKPT